jgi:hypothetical protein
MVLRSKSSIFLPVVEEEQRAVMVIYIVYQWVTQGTKGSIDNMQRPGRGSMMRPTINEESDCLRKKVLVCCFASAIAYYPGGRARKMGPLAVLPHH